MCVFGIFNVSLMPKQKLFVVIAQPFQIREPTFDSMVIAAILITVFSCLQIPRNSNLRFHFGDTMERKGQYGDHGESQAAYS